MSSSKVLFFQALIVACLLGFAMSAPANKNPLGDFFCDTCKSTVEQYKNFLPQVKPQLEQLCQYCGSAENTQKCVEKLDQLVDQASKASPEEICSLIGLCKKPSFQDFAGQF